MFKKFDLSWRKNELTKENIIILESIYLYNNLVISISSLFLSLHLVANKDISVLIDIEI